MASIADNTYKCPRELLNKGSGLYAPYVRVCALGQILAACRQIIVFVIKRLLFVSDRSTYLERTNQTRARRRLRDRDVVVHHFGPSLVLMKIVP